MIKTIEHFNFELLLEGSYLGWGSKNCWSLGLLLCTHRTRWKKLLKLDRNTLFDFKVLLVLKKTTNISCF
jgi:hypothetical protein